MNWLKRVIFAAEVLALSANTIKASDSLWIALWRPAYRPVIFFSGNDGLGWDSIACDPSWPIGTYPGCALTAGANNNLFLALWDDTIKLHLYKSTDYGYTWAYVTDIESNVGGHDPYISMIADSTGNLYATTYVYKAWASWWCYSYNSFTNGNTWSPKMQLFPADDYYEYHGTEAVVAITVDKVGTLYGFVCPGEWGGYSSAPRCIKSTNKCTTWVEVCDSVCGTNVSNGNQDPALGITAGADNSLYSLFWYDYIVPTLYHSTNVGVSWDSIYAFANVGDGSTYNSCTGIICAKSGAFYSAFWGDNVDAKNRRPTCWRSANGVAWTLRDTIVDWVGVEHVTLSLVNISIGSPAGGVEEQEKCKVQNAKLEAYPNPFTTKAVIEFTLNQVQGQSSELGDLQLQIYDLSGRLVKTLFDSQASLSQLSTLNSQLSVIWDGRDNSGKRVDNGIYFVKFKAENYEETTKLILVK